MGEHLVQEINLIEERAVFIRHLLEDIEALEQMLQKGMIEDNIVRIGAEQEFCLITNKWRPAKNAQEILADIQDEHFTTEIAKYNLEINLDPVVLSNDCFTVVRDQLAGLLNKASLSAKKHNSRILLTGILPTITQKELSFDYMTPIPRYWALNNKFKELRGSHFNLHLRGVDELHIRHDSVLFEGCNTSFQMHLQIPPQDFISSYNWAQTIAAPILGICTNSPLLLGRELWNETRIALFRQSLDTRKSSLSLTDQRARVSFGNSWATGSIAEVFKNDVANHKILLSKEIPVGSLEQLKKGEIPKLAAIRLHNGTIYRWNRPCYGIGNGKPHIRIENRYIPSGPTIEDEIANFVFWVGLMMGRPKKFDNMPDYMDFKEVKSNFIKTARTGKDAILNWMGQPVSVQDLVLKELLPIAHAGLEKMKIRQEDREKYLGIIENRAKGTNGATWIIRNYRKLNKKIKQDDALRLLTKHIYKNQNKQECVHDWPDIPTPSKIPKGAHLVGHIMTTQLFTIHEKDIASLATSVMKWKDIHHVPIENSSGQFCGLLTWNHVRKFQAEKSKPYLLVADIMVKDVITVFPETPIKQAIHLMKTHKIGCLPVIHDQNLVGIITDNDVREFNYDQNS